MIKIEGLGKTFPAVDGNGQVEVLKNIDLTVGRGEILAIVGPSGAGKSTLARCINLLERPTSGSITIDDVNLSHLAEHELRRARRSIGTIFQTAPLLRRRTVQENVVLPLSLLGATREAQERISSHLLERVGLQHHARHYPGQLSGGQRQRVGIARALTLNPSLVLADEPTSGLDPETTTSILHLLQDLRRDLDLSIILITHEMAVVREVADTVARLDHGTIVEQGLVRDILLDPDSTLGAQLLPELPSPLYDGPGTLWHVTYAATTVATDWVTRVTRQFEPQGSVGILAAAIEPLSGVVVGRAVLVTEGIAPAAFTQRLAAEGLRAVRGADDERAVA